MTAWERIKEVLAELSYQMIYNKALGRRCKSYKRH